MSPLDEIVAVRLWRLQLEGGPIWSSPRSCSTILDLDMVYPRAPATGSAPQLHTRIWKVFYNDGLYGRSEGAALVIAESASEAIELVIAADPFDGHPYYGVPAVYGPAEPFHPQPAYLLWVSFD